MSVDRIHGYVVFICDVCGDDFETGTKDFHEAVQAAKDEGWLVMKEDEGYTHVCPDCSSDDADGDG